MPSYIEGVLSGKVTVDGDDATVVIEDMIKASRFHRGLHAIMLDGASLGGFNVLDIYQINKALDVPLITVTRDEPDMEQIRHALEGHFDDWKARLDILSKGEFHGIDTGHNPLFIKCAGISPQDARRILVEATVRGAVPEAIRVAHLIATAVVKGESVSKA